MQIDLDYLDFIRNRNFFNHKIENALQENFLENYKTKKYDFLINYFYEEDGLDSQKIMIFNFYTFNEFIEDFYKKQLLEMSPDYGDGFPEDSHVWIIIKVDVISSISNKKQIFKNFGQHLIDESI